MAEQPEKQSERGSPLEAATEETKMQQSEQTPAASEGVDKETEEAIENIKTGLKRFMS